MSKGSIAANGRVDRSVSGWRWLLWVVFGRHKWDYRNPYDRRCSVCGRHEVSFCQSLETWNRSWWEVWNEGDERKHYEASNERNSGAAEGGPAGMEG